MGGRLRHTLGHPRGVLGWLWLSAGLISCATPVEGRQQKTEPPREAFEKTERAQPLPELERKRLDYFFESAGLVADAWPVLKDADTCVLLLAETMQWIVACDEAPPGFTPLGPDFRKRPVYARPGGNFDADGRALSTAELLAVTPATAHVDEPGAQRSALSSRHPWLLLGSLDALRKYHPAFHDCTTEEWLSVAMHELYHTQALRLPSFAASLSQINTHALDRKPLVELYTSDAGYRALVAREYALLVAAANHPPAKKAQARRTLAAWRGLYRARRANLAARPDGAKLVASDSLFTYVEGVARYVESTFLNEPAQHPSDDLLGDPRFHSFSDWESFGYGVMPNRQLDSEYYYAIGFHLGLLLDRVDPNWKRNVHSRPEWLIGVAETDAQKTAPRAGAKL